jgi:hypothetical protein
MDKLVREKLSPDEKILWEGRPEIGILSWAAK